MAVRVLARDAERARTRLSPTIDVVVGDITRMETLPRAIAGATHIVFTAGCRSGRPATEANIRSTEFGGVVNTLQAARGAGFSGRLLYMTASGVTSRSVAAVVLNLYKGNTLVWRRRAEVEIRSSALGNL